MKINILCVLLLTSYARAYDDKTLTITGPLVAPWVKGELCAGYWSDQERVWQCFNVGAGRDYILRNIPAGVGHVKITRTFDKTCKVKKNGKRKCRTIKGKFFIPEPDNTLNLTYDHEHILNHYTIPPEPPHSNFGMPTPGPASRSPRFTPDYSGDASEMFLS